LPCSKLSESSQLAGALTSFSWAGEVRPVADGITFTINNDAGAGIGSMTIGTITSAGDGDLTINSEGIGALTVTNGSTFTAGGSVMIDADTGATDHGITGAVSLGGIDMSAAGATTSYFSLNAGDSGFSSTVETGAINVGANVTNAGGVMITTTGTGGFAGLVTTGAITNSSTGGTGAQVIIGPGSGAGSGDMVGFTATGLISNAAGTLKPITIGSSDAASLQGALSLAGITNAAADDAADIQFLAQSFGAITSTVLLQATGTSGDILFTANGATTTGSMGAITVTGDGTDAIVTANAGNTIAFSATDDIGNLVITGNVGGAGGAVSFTADAGGTADTGDIGDISVSGGDLGNAAASVTITGVNIGTIDATDIGNGAGAVQITAADDAATEGTAAKGTIGAIGSGGTLATIGNGAGGVTFNADDGIGATTTTGAVAAGGTVTYNGNLDAKDDFGGVGAMTIGGAVGTTGALTLVVNTNNGATDNTLDTTRTIGAIEVSGNFARLDLTADGDIGLITVDGGNAGANVLEIVQIDTNATTSPTNPIDLVGISVPDVAGVAGSVTRSGDIVITGILGTAGITAGADTTTDTDVLALGANKILIYNGDDPAVAAGDDADGFGADYSSGEACQVVITTGDITGGGYIKANFEISSPAFTGTLDGESFVVDISSSDSTSFTAMGKMSVSVVGAHEYSVALDDLDGLPADGTGVILVASPSGTEFDVTSLTLASTTSSPDIESITIEGDLSADIGDTSNGFGNVQSILIEGNVVGVRTFYGSSLAGYGVGGGTLTIPNTVTITPLVRDVDSPNPLTITAAAGGSLTYYFADINATTTFNHQITVTSDAVDATVTLYGINGNLTGDTGSDTGPYDFTMDPSDATYGSQSGAAFDPNNVLATAGDAMISRIDLLNVEGLEVDAAVREVTGVTTGSFFEFATDVGLFEVSTAIGSIAVGIDPGGAGDDADTTDVAASATDGDDFDRLGDGRAGGNMAGLNAGTFISDVDASLGHLIVQSVSAPGVDTINIVVTGNVGTITLTGDPTDPSAAGVTTTPDYGNFTVNNNANVAAIAIGGNLEGPLTIPGQIICAGADIPDILVGIGLDLNDDGDVADTAIFELDDGVATTFDDAGHDLNGDGDATDTDTYSELPGTARGAATTGGMINGVITIGDAPNTDIIAYNDINEDVIIQGQDRTTEGDFGPEIDGDLHGIKAGGELGDDTNDMKIIVARDLDFAIADGVLSADIFVGGVGSGAAGATAIEGTGITGAAVLGGVNGIGDLTITDHAVAGDAARISDITMTLGGGDAAMVVQWAAGDITTNGTVGNIYVLGTLTDLDIAATNGDAIDAGDIFFLDDGMVDVSSPGDIGVLVVADDASVLSSAALLDLVTVAAADYNSVIWSPTALDTANGDQGANLSYTGTIVAENAGGVVAEGAVDVSADIDGNMGYIVALDGSVNSGGDDVHAGLSIGHIVASTDIDGSFISEGTLAIGTADAMNTAISGFGLDGVPAWFTGGILAEVGDIGSNADEVDNLDTGTYWYNSGDTEAVFRAQNVTMIGGVEVIAPAGDAMGAIYVVSGGMSAQINVTGNFAGIQVPAGPVWVDINVYGGIQRMIAPNYTETATSDRPEAVIEATNGEEIVTENNGFAQAGVSVVVPTGVIGIVDNSDGDATSIDQVILLSLGAGTATITGDVDELFVVDGWGGDVVVVGSGTDGTDGVIDLIKVDGTVTGNLTAYDFNAINGTEADLAAVTEYLPTLNRDNRVETISAADSLSDNGQTLFLNGSRRVEADVTTVFGKVTEVSITGRGRVDFLSLEGVTTDQRELRRIASRGVGDLDGSAHIGELLVESDRVKLDDVIVEGNLVKLSNSKALNDLWVSGNAGDISVHKLNAAFINGNLGTLSAWRVRNTDVMGTTNNLVVTQHVVNSHFIDEVANWDIGGRTPRSQINYA